MQNRTTPALTIAAALVACSAYFVLAGDTNPPGGPVAPTMRTNQEIFDAVQSLGSLGGGGNDACSLAIPGAARGVGVISFATLPGAGASPVDSNMYGFAQQTTQSAGFGGGGGGGVTTIGAFTFTRDVDANSFRFFRTCATGTHITTATVTLSDGVQNYLEYRFTDVIVSSVAPRMVQRCDGTVIHVEDISIRAAKMKVTDLISGNSYEWNTQTGSGS